MFAIFWLDEQRDRRTVFCFKHTGLNRLSKQLFLNTLSLKKILPQHLASAEQKSLAVCNDPCHLSSCGQAKNCARFVYTAKQCIDEPKD